MILQWSIVYFSKLRKTVLEKERLRLTEPFIKHFWCYALAIFLANASESTFLVTKESTTATASITEHTV